jgi:glycosyltransferase involved in cell wall biosynthesis
MCKGDIETMVARPLTIVQLLPELVTGGVERGTLEVGAYLAKKGHRSIVISNGGPMVAQLLKEGSEHIELPVHKKSPFTVGCIPRLKKIFASQNVDIVHLRSRVPAWAGWLAVKMMNEQFRPRVITTFHGFYSINRYSAIMTKGDVVIAVSNVIRQHIKEQYGVPEKRIRLINRGFDAAQFNPDQISDKRMGELKQRWGIDQAKGPVLILPGRFTKLKGHTHFLNALEKIKDLAWTAVLIGDEKENISYFQHLKSEVLQKKLSERVVFAGLCNDMPAAFSLADLTVSASTYPESFGRVAVESQAMGIPVIASALGGSLETVKHEETGWLYPADDVVALARVLELAIQNQTMREKYGAQGQRWVNDQFTVEKMCSQTLEVYQELVFN